MLLACSISNKNVINDRKKLASMFLLTINGTYTTVEAALTSEKGTSTASISHHHASTELLPLIEKLCAEHNLSIRELTAIAVNVGPGPFTTMRSVIATINGLAYAAQIPLLPVNGIAAFVKAHKKKEYTHTCALLNAFCNDVYYALYDYATDTISSGCCSIEYWMQEHLNFLKTHPHVRINYIGNGCTLYQKELATQFGMHTIPDQQAPQVPDVAAIIAAAQQTTARVAQIEPLYFKPYVPHGAK